MSSWVLVVYLEIFVNLAIILYITSIIVDYRFILNFMVQMGGSSL